MADRSCTFDGCGRPAESRGLCHAHYQQWRKGKDLSPVARRPRRSVEERFWEKVSQDGECWIWTGSQTGGRGTFYLGGGPKLAHRVSYEMMIADIPPGLQLDHLCRRPLCVNPYHLEPVTNQENQRRGVNSYAIRTRCKSGRHDITREGSRRALPRGRWTCLECSRESNRLRKRRLRAVPPHVST